MPSYNALKSGPVIDAIATSVGVRSQDAWVMLLSTIRYSMGRSTYMSGLCVDLYNRYRNALSLTQRSQISEEIASELRRAESSGTTLGMSMDHKIWSDLRDQIVRELSV